MFGLSLSKLLFTALVIIAVWKGVGMLDKLRKRISDEQPSQGKQPIEMVACEHCGAYVPSDQLDARERCANCRA
ncbi:MAG: hypothetical protein ACFB6S_02955 [Geminicoccaceae bacterium]